MVDLFSPLTPEARRENRAAYQSFLTARDGVVDVERRTLTHREEGMARYTRPLSRLRELDRPLFDAQYASFDPKVAMPPEIMLLVALVKVNAAESFGANRTYEKVFRHALKHNDALELTLVIEETYHTRILLSSAVLYGIEVTSPFKPPASDVLVDELGHVSFNRMCLGGAGLAQARMMLPVLGMTLGGVIPELSALGVMSAYSERDLDALYNGTRLPEHVRKAAFLS